MWYKFKPSLRTQLTKRPNSVTWDTSSIFIFFYLPFITWHEEYNSDNSTVTGSKYNSEAPAGAGPRIVICLQSQVCVSSLSLITLPQPGGSLASGQTYASFQQTNTNSPWRNNCSSEHFFSQLCHSLTQIAEAHAI